MVHPIWVVLALFYPHTIWINQQTYGEPPLPSWRRVHFFQFLKQCFEHYSCNVHYQYCPDRRSKGCHHVKPSCGGPPPPDWGNMFVPSNNAHLRNESTLYTLVKYMIIMLGSNLIYLSLPLIFLIMFPRISCYGEHMVILKNNKSFNTLLNNYLAVITSFTDFFF